MASGDRLDLRTRARTRADQSSSLFPSDAEYNIWLDEGGRTTYHDLLDGGFPFDESTVSITVSGVSDFYPLGVSAAGITLVTRRDGTRSVELKRLPREDEANKLSQLSTLATHYLPKQNITQGAGITLYPQVASGVYRVAYIPAWPGFTNDADLWRGPPRSDELIVLQAAAKGCRKEGEVSDAAALMEEYRDLLLRVVASASYFDRRNPALIRDEQDKTSRDLFDFDVELY